MRRSHDMLVKPVLLLSLRMCTCSCPGA